MKSAQAKAAATKQANLDQVVNLIAVPDDGKLMAIADRRTTPPVEVKIPNAKQRTAAANKAAKSAKTVLKMVADQLNPTKRSATQKAINPTKAEQLASDAAVSAKPETSTILNGDGSEIISGYNGPMRALRDRVKAGKYTKAANGQPSCGDDVAQVLGALEPAEVIKACMIAMDIANPYLALNIGQQSMNLRNKLRGQLKRGEIGMGVLREAVEVVMENRPTK